MKEKPRTTRRGFVGAITAVALVGCGDHGESDPSGTAGSSGSGGTGGSSGSSGTGGSAGTAGSSGAGGSAGSGGDAGACTLYPQQTEGPFYLDDDLVRADITEGKSGTPLTMTIVVLSANGCAPLPNVAVDIWQCDAGGVYSGYPGQLGGLDTTGQTFLRGTQITGADGKAVFQTIYPGWYPGRTTHIHVKVRPTSTSEATSQIYFPEDVTTAIYQTPPYDARGPKDTSNAADGVNAGNVPPLAAVTQTAGGYDASLTITIAG
jgi:protocatechuate 3,4-dioxygenase beta subunit